MAGRKLGDANRQGAGELVVTPPARTDTESTRFDVFRILIGGRKGSGLSNGELIEEHLLARVHPFLGRLVAADEELPMSRPGTAATPCPTWPGHIRQGVSAQVPIQAQQVAASHVHYHLPRRSQANGRSGSSTDARERLTSAPHRFAMEAHGQLEWRRAWSIRMLGRERARGYGRRFAREGLVRGDSFACVAMPRRGAAQNVGERPRRIHAGPREQPNPAVWSGRLDALDHVLIESILR